MIYVVVDDDSITVSVTGLGCKGSNKHGGKTRVGRCHCSGEVDSGYKEDSSPTA